MKKLIFALVILLALNIGYAQESKTYVITQTEWYLYNEASERWELQTQNKSVSIDLVNYKNVINIQAKTPTLYRLDENSKKEINGKDWSGLRYNAIECVDMAKCTVDIIFLNSEGSDKFLFSVITEKDNYKVNLRFYAKYQ